jgi:uncharacterized damage-inducible protein DinB
MSESNLPIVEAWQTHCRLNQQFIDAIPAEALSAKLAGKGRSIGAIITHLHNNRLNWLKPGAPNLHTGLKKIQRNETENKLLLLANLDSSGTAIAQWLTNSLEKGGKVKAFGGQAASFMGYLVAHESYHHGEMGLILGQAGFSLDKKEAYALWNWK